MKEIEYRWANSLSSLCHHSVIKIKNDDKVGTQKTRNDELMQK